MEIIQASIIIPSFNKSNRLEACLREVKKQSDYFEGIETIVIDNGSSDENIQIAKKYATNVFEYLDSKSPYPCRNIGVQNSNGEILIFLDSSCIPSANWLKNILQFFTTNKNQKTVLLGNISFELDQNSTLSEIADSILFCDAKIAAEQKRILGGNFAVKKKNFIEIGFFNEKVRSGADTNWGMKASEKGFTICYKNEIEVFYPSKKYKELMQKAFRVGKGLSYFDNENPKSPITLKLSIIKNALLPPNLRFYKKINSKIYSKLNKLDLLIIWIIIYKIQLIKEFARLDIKLL